MRLIEKVFESIKADEEKMKYFLADPMRDAAFHALYAYVVKEGKSLSQLPWFSLCDIKWFDKEV